MSSRAHALRRLAAWDRYRRRYQDPGATGHGRPALVWWLRARRHRRHRWSGGAR